MPRLKFDELIASEEYRSIRSAEHKGETNDCTVIAVMRTTGVDYATAHKALAAQGRKERRGTHKNNTHAAIISLGFQVEKRNPEDFLRQYPGVHATALSNVTTHHPKRFNKVWKDGKNYLFYTARHVSAVLDGVNLDWSRRHAQRVYAIYEVMKTVPATVNQEGETK